MLKRPAEPLVVTSGLNTQEELSTSWSSSYVVQTLNRMAESSRAKVKELLARHSELEQSETKAQAALVTILSLTQITELKLLLDIGRLGHRFYDFVLTLLIACILLELCVGIIIIYIGNLHYYQNASGVDAVCGGCCYAGGGGFVDCLLCCCRCCCRAVPRAAASAKRHGNYLSVQTASAGAGGPMIPGGGERSDGTAALQTEQDIDDDWATAGRRRRYESEGGVLERADTGIEAARVKVAGAEVRIVRAANYARVVEEALRRTPGNAELEEELGRARDELAAARREKDETEAEQRLAEALQRRAFFAKEQREDHRERVTFRRISRWQHLATYLLYFVMLMNVFITTFGISGGRHDSVIGRHSDYYGAAAAAAAPAYAVAAATHYPVEAASSTSLVPPTVASTVARYDPDKYDVILGDRSSMGNASYYRAT